MKTFFITGASRGIGRELTEQILTRGDRVAATLRHPEQLDDLQQQHSDRLWTRRLDVTDTDEIQRVVNEAFADHDRIDVVVSNAGYGVSGAAEDLEDAQVEAMIATNLTGSIQLARRVVPHLRNQGGGVLVQLSSMGAHIGFPGFAIYHATKWGVEGYFEALAQEIAPFGISTILVEPGMVRTSFYDAVERVRRSEPYRGGPADGPKPSVETMPGSQSGLAHAIIEAALMEQPPRRLLLNSDAYEAVTTTVRKRLASWEAQRDSAYAADAEYDMDMNERGSTSGATVRPSPKTYDGPRSTGRGLGMDDIELMQRIGALVDEEHRLERSDLGEGPSPDKLERLKAIEVALDQCWDLLRQRRARRSAGREPDDAAVRPESIVEGYQQ